MTAVVRVSDYTTDDIHVRNGLRQGCTMAPVLLNLYFVAMVAGADLGFLRGGANHSSGSLKQGVWGAQPPRSYRIFCFMKYRNAT